MSASFESQLGHSPGFSLVNRYFIAAAASFLIWSFLLTLHAADIQGFHFQKLLLGLTHLAVLGWVSMTIFGALFQLVPVVLETGLFSERIAKLQFWLYVPGIVGMVTGFWFFRFGAPFLLSAGLVLLAITLFIGNVAATIMRGKCRDVTVLFLSTALLYLALTAAIGFSLALNLRYFFIVRRDHLDFLKIHAHLGLAGWILQVIMGVSLKLIPMFTLSHGFSTRPAKVAYCLVNAGLVGLALGWWLQWGDLSTKIAAAVMAAGALSFLFQVYAVFKRRLRRRPDLGMRFSMAGFFYFAVSAIWGISLTFVSSRNETDFEPAVLTYGVFILLGFLSSLIVGQMYKIVPFLVWHHKFSSKVGLEPVPLLKDLFSERIGIVQWWVMNASVVSIAIGVFWDRSPWRLMGFACLTLSAVLFSCNLIRVYQRRAHGLGR